MPTITVDIDCDDCDAVAKVSEETVRAIRQKFADGWSRHGVEEMVFKHIGHGVTTRCDKAYLDGLLDGLYG